MVDLHFAAKEFLRKISLFIENEVAVTMGDIVFICKVKNKVHGIPCSCNNPSTKLLYVTQYRDDLPACIDLVLSLKTAFNWYSVPLFH
jgi:hypothetical protein